MTEPFIVQAAPEAQTLLPVLQPFADELADTRVTDLFVNGATGLFIDRGNGADRVPSWRASEREVRDLAAALIGAGGRHIDDAHPCVDVRLPGGYRVHAVLAPVAASGTAISIRVPRAGRSNVDALAERGAFGVGVEEWLRAAIARRANFLVSGAAGVGKTTLLSALLSESPQDERIVTIEDVVELDLDHPHHVALESRQANLEGAGAVTLATLVREALRMKPDRLVIGECRGAEVRELLTALNTGHDGGAGTVHANSLADVATRLEALGALAGLGDTALARQVVSALEFVVHLEKDRSGRRHVAAIGEFRLVGDRLTVIPRDIGTVTEQRAVLPALDGGVGAERGHDALERGHEVAGVIPDSARADLPDEASPATPEVCASATSDLAAHIPARLVQQSPTVPDAEASSARTDAGAVFDALVRGLDVDPAPETNDIERSDAAREPRAGRERFTPSPPSPPRRRTGGRHDAAA